MPKRLARATFVVPLGDGAELTCDVSTAAVRAVLARVLSRVQAASKGFGYAEVSLSEWDALIDSGLVTGWSGFTGDDGKPLAFDRALLTCMSATDIDEAIEAALNRSEWGVLAAAQVEVNAADPTEPAT